MLNVDSFISELNYINYCIYWRRKKLL